MFDGSTLTTASNSPLQRGDERFWTKDKENENSGLFAAATLPLKLVKTQIIKAARRNWGPAWRHREGHVPGRQPGTICLPRCLMRNL